MIRVLLAEDHAAVREGLKLLLDAQSDMEVVGEADDGKLAVERASLLKPDVVVLDLTMPRMTGLMAARALTRASAEAKIVALTRHDDEAYVHALFDAGAAAYVLKQSASAELVRAIRVAASGGRYVDPALSAPGGAADTQGRPAPPRPTEREEQVLRLMAIGHSNKEIAAQLHISVKTVEVHKTNVTRKLGLRGRTDVVRYAILRGWLREL